MRPFNSTPCARRLLLPALALLATASAACTDLPMPPDLAAPQILGVRAANPAIPAGERTALDLLLGGPAGIIEPDSVEWEVVGLSETAPALGTIEFEGDQAFYVAPDSVTDIELATVQVTVTSGDRVLEAIKGVAVGAPVATENPQITDLVVDGASVAPGSQLSMSVEAVAALDLRVSPEPGDDADYAWYSNVAEIDLFRRVPSELVAAEEPGEGVLIGVYRDGLGGIDWTSVELVVEP